MVLKIFMPVVDIELGCAVLEGFACSHGQPLWPLKLLEPCIPLSEREFKPFASVQDDSLGANIEISSMKVATRPRTVDRSICGM